MIAQRVVIRDHLLVNLAPLETLLVVQLPIQHRVKRNLVEPRSAQTELVLLEPVDRRHLRPIWHVHANQGPLLDHGVHQPLPHELGEVGPLHVAVGRKKLVEPIIRGRRSRLPVLALSAHSERDTEQVAGQEPDHLSHVVHIGRGLEAPFVVLDRLLGCAIDELPRVLWLLNLESALVEQS